MEQLWETKQRGILSLNLAIRGDRLLRNALTLVSPPLSSWLGAAQDECGLGIDSMARDSI